MLLREVLSGIAALSLLAGAAAAQPQPLATAAVQGTGAAESAGFDGVVEALRQTTIAAQVSGAIVGIEVKVGDTVKAGQVLVRIDARAADQNAAASAAQVQAARASLEVAAKEFERQKQLHSQQYISQAALDRAEAQFKANEAAARAQLAQAGAAQTQSGFYVVKAPYAGVVAELPISLGDMAMPGRPLLAVYDPTALRVTASLPQTAAARLGELKGLKVELPGLPAARQWIGAERVQVLPTVDPATHTVQVRLELPARTEGVAPGMFARAWLPLQGAASGRLFVPARAIVKRAEMTGVYVVDVQGRAVLRQVRLGRAANGSVEVLSGVSAGERVALDPQAAARQP